MRDHPIRIGWSRAAILLDCDTNPDYGTPYQLQLELTGRLERDAIDPEDPYHPANQGRDLEVPILKWGGQVLAKRLGHPIITVYCSSLVPPSEPDPIGGIVVYHPTEPCYARPDGFYLCPATGQAWLVDAKRYGKAMDQRVAKIELLAQLTGMLDTLMQAAAKTGWNPGLLLPRGYDDPLVVYYELQELTFAAVIRFDVTRIQQADGTWENLIVPVPDLLEVPTDAATRQGIVTRVCDWMRTYVLPWYDGDEPPPAAPIDWTDLNLRWPTPAPGKEIVIGDDPQLEALVYRHSALCSAAPTVELTLGDETRRWTVPELEAGKKEAKTAIFHRLSASGDGDAECIVREPAGDAICTLPSIKGVRQVSYKTVGYNKERAKTRKNGEL